VFIRLTPFADSANPGLRELWLPVDEIGPMQVIYPVMAGDYPDFDPAPFVQTRIVSPDGLRVYRVKETPEEIFDLMGEND
jgi:hypothetical protein